MLGYRANTIIVLVIWFAESAYAARVERLAAARGTLSLPPYTSVHRQTLAEQSLLTIEKLFVHREIKIEDFGVENDPVPKLARLTRRAQSLGNALFHDRLASIFLGMHDLHTNYIAPRPRSCGSPFIPLRFSGVVDEGQNRILVSGKITRGAEYVTNIDVGMRLISVNARPIERVLNDLGQVSGGANNASMRYRAIQMLSFRGSNIYPLPDENEMEMVFIGEDGERVTASIPWLTLIDEVCLDSVDDEIGNGLSLSEAMNMAQDEFQKKYNDLFKPPRLLPHTTRDTRPEDIDRADTSRRPWASVFDFSIISTPAGRLGYLELKSFYWSNSSLDVATVLDAIRNVLETDLASADSLVIDVRGNPGGLIVFSEKLVQLFSPQGVKPTKVRMLANDLNRKIFVEANGRGNRWSEAIERAIDGGDVYMDPMAITPLSEANAMGQVWFKPVVVLTDAGCYSACDLFSAGMQDNNAAKVIGVHSRTGAGGANVMEYNVFRKIMQNDPDSPFERLPYGHNLRVSWRQSVRSGESAGELLENRGVVSDVIVPLTSQDVLFGESRQMMRQIHRAINQSSRGTSGLESVPGGLFFLENGSPASWRERIFGVDTLVVKNADRIVSEYEIDRRGTRAIDLDVNNLSGMWGDVQLTLIGFNRGEQVMRVVRELRWRGEYAAIPSEGLEFTFDRPDSLMHFVSLRGGEESGWQTVGGRLRVGEGANYDSNVLTRAYIPLDLSGRGGRVTLDMVVKAESLNDSLRIYCLNVETNERKHIYAGSQFSLRRGVGFQLPRNWNRTELVFEFESDENWNFAGPEIDNLLIAQ